MPSRLTAFEAYARQAGAVRLDALLDALASPFPHDVSSAAYGRDRAVQRVLRAQRDSPLPLGWHCWHAVREAPDALDRAVALYAAAKIAASASEVAHG